MRVERHICGVSKLRIHHRGFYIGKAGGAGAFTLTTLGADGGSTLFVFFFSVHGSPW